MCWIKAAALAAALFVAVPAAHGEESMFVIVSGSGAPLLRGPQYGEHFAAGHIEFMRSAPEVKLVEFPTWEAARAYIAEKGFNEFTGVVPKSEVVP